MDGLIADLLHKSQQEIGPRKQKLVHCMRKHATHVSGKGIAGCIAPVDLIRVIGRSPIPDWQYKEMVGAAMRRVGKPVF
jgi:hypothetical protein